MSKKVANRDYEGTRAKRVAESKAEGDRYRALSLQIGQGFGQPSGAEFDWEVLERPEVKKAIYEATSNAQRKFSDAIELADLEQEANIIVATKISDLAWKAVAEEGGYDIRLFKHALYMDLVNHMVPRSKHVIESVEFTEETYAQAVGLLRPDGGMLASNSAVEVIGFRGGSGLGDGDPL